MCGSISLFSKSVEAITYFEKKWFFLKAKPSNIWLVEAVGICVSCTVGSYEIYMALLSLHWNNIVPKIYQTWDSNMQRLVRPGQHCNSIALKNVYLEHFQVYCLPIWSAQEQITVIGGFYFAAIIFLFSYSDIKLQIVAYNLHVLINQLLAGEFHKHMASDR